ncbi:endothelial lipase-like [Macrosteles quadrilineatus]|uniref:endothelial lipase-like n=1 Tax=Macrosteles quadrilineatus TaxID=74068 RepID=UPI0023E307A7|nr:endothelial lipase-like [Macrosteles quadrilineatus]
MAALLFAFYLFDMTYVKVKVYHKTGYGFKGKFKRLPRALRNFKPERDVYFYLFTEHNTHQGHRIYPEKPSSLFISHFDFNKDVKILIHGWKNTGNSTFGRTVKDAYISQMGVNVIVVDWHKLSILAYHRSCRHMDMVAVRVAILYDFLRQYVARRAIHIIGHSLGAHVAGIAGEVVQRGKIYRITGLDPAGPMISKIRTHGRLDKEDAEFVDVIHTSGFMLGFYSPLGHADFYPNKGTPIQPGCGVDVVGRCSHRRSYHLFQESIFNSSEFMALQCQNWKHFVKNKCFPTWHRMGEHIQYGIEGKFFLRTARKSPFDVGYTTDLKSRVHNLTTISNKTV